MRSVESFITRNGKLSISAMKSIIDGSDGN
jgi:hypothetical protein